MSSTANSGWRATRARTVWLCASLTLVLLPHAVRMPIWVTIGFVMLAYWRIEHVFRGVRLPGRWSRVALSIAIVIGVFLSYGTLFGRTAGIAALAVLAGMKLLETDTLRDAYAVVFLSFFLIITNFLYSQTIPTGLYMLLVVAVIGATLMAINSEERGLLVRQRLRYVSAMLVQAAPLMLCLFVLFPRIPGPLWGLPKDAHSASSGLSDSMSPGAISQLSQSSEVAFRVNFDGPIPPASKLYWRGPVFNVTDGRTWSAGEPLLTRHSPQVRRTGPALDYTLTMEPHSQHWVFALDVPASAQPGIRVTDDYQLLSMTRVRERKQFRLRSFPNAEMVHMSPRQRRAALRVPSSAHPKTKALASRWRRETNNDVELVAKALTYFRQNPFFYTLSPPLLNGDTVDEFLFGTRRGFCEHYSAAFTILMRAAGIPTRIVTGYQGGDVNPLGEYVIVRQRDAHAWAEVWLAGKGWARVDPTAAVSPQRIELGMDAALPTSIGPAALGFEPSGSVASFFKRLHHGWDAVSNSWNQWILGYGARRQKELLSSLGLDGSDWRALLLTLLGALGIGMFFVFLWLLRTRANSDPVSRAYTRFCAKLARRGLARHVWEGPNDYAERICRQRPELESEVGRICELYVRIRYADASTDVTGLTRAIAAFRP